MSIGILGTENETDAMLGVVQILKGLGFRNTMQQEQYKRIINNGPYKPIAEQLKQFIGIYDVEVVSYPDWFNEFFNKLAMDLTDSLNEDDKKEIEKEFMEEFENDKINSKLSIKTKKLIEVFKQFTLLTPVVFDTGKLPNGHKILKFCKKAYEAMDKANKDQAHTTDWYKLFESKNTSNDCSTKIVITNSQLSFLAMASVFDNPDHTSCQDISKASYTGSNIKGLAANLLDKNSLICYISKGNTRLIKSKSNIVTVKHQTMITRMMLRLVKDNHNQIYIIPDRAYPHKTYSPSIITLLKELCDKTNGKVKVGIFANYTQEQHNTNSTNFEIEYEKNSVDVKEIHSEEILFEQKFIWDDEQNDDNKIKTTGSCGHSSYPEECKFSGKNKFKCKNCVHNMEIKYAVTYHDNMIEREYPQPNTIVRKSKINVIASKWRTKEKKEG